MDHSTLIACLTQHRDHAAGLIGFRSWPDSQPFTADTDQLALRSPQAEIDDALGDPLGFALRAAAREIGWATYATGGINAMAVLFAKVAKIMPSGAVVLHDWWDGIGTPSGGVWRA